MIKKLESMLSSNVFHGIEKLVHLLTEIVIHLKTLAHLNYCYAALAAKHRPVVSPLLRL